jgi:hypothetical protein
MPRSLKAEFALAIIVLTCLPACTNSDNGSSESGQDAQTHAQEVTPQCQGSIVFSEVAVKRAQTGDYSSGYENAQEAVKDAAACSEDSVDMVKGSALAARALNEHFLSVGNSKRDLSESDALLRSCANAEHGESASKINAREQMDEDQCDKITRFKSRDAEARYSVDAVGNGAQAMTSFNVKNADAGVCLLEYVANRDGFIEPRLSDLHRRVLEFYATLHVDRKAVNPGLGILAPDC